MTKSAFSSLALVSDDFTLDFPVVGRGCRIETRFSSILKEFAETRNRLIVFHLRFVRAGFFARAGTGAGSVGFCTRKSTCEEKPYDDFLAGEEEEGGGSSPPAPPIRPF